MKKARIIAVLLATLMVIVAVSCKEPHVHDFKWEVEKAATCTEKGTEVQICSECKEKGETREIAALGHKEVVDAAVAATFTAKGKTEGKHCSVCKEILVAQQEVPMTGHTYVLSVNEKGEAVNKCSACQHEEAVEGVDVVKSEEELKAFFSATDEKKSILANEITLTTAITSTGTKVLELNGKTIKAEGIFTTDIITNEGTLAINNGTISYEGLHINGYNVGIICNYGEFKSSKLNLTMEIKEHLEGENQTGTGNNVVFVNRGAGVAEFNETSVVMTAEEFVAKDVKFLGVFNLGKTVYVKDSTIDVSSDNQGKVYGLYLDIEKGETSDRNAVVTNSKITAFCSKVASVTPVFAESYRADYSSTIKITDSEIIGQSSLETASEKKVYSVRAKGNASIDLNNVTLKVDVKTPGATAVVKIADACEYSEACARTGIITGK